MQSLRKNNENYGELAEIQFRTLIESFEKNGYDKESRINVFNNLKLYDGSHRIALGLYHHLKNISIRILPKEESINFSLEWFEKNNFSAEEINIIKNKADELLSEWKIVEFVGIFWGSTLSFVEEAIDDLKNFGVITNILHHEYRREEYNNIIKAIYAIDDIASWKVDKKIRYLSKYPSEIVSFYLNIEPKYRTKQMSNLPLSVNGEEIKKLIRSKYQYRLDNYYYDVILHIADNSYQSDYMKSILSFEINFQEILNKIQKFKYALTGLEVPYMPKDFPNSIPIGKDIDILVLHEDYRSMIDQLTDIANSYINKYDIVIREKTNVNTQIRYEKYGRPMFILDIICGVEGFNYQFIEDSINSRVDKKNYFILDDFYEYLYRLMKYSENKSEWWHYKYLHDNKKVYDREKASKYCSINLEDIL